MAYTFQELPAGKVRRRIRISNPNSNDVFCALIASDNISAFEKVYGEVLYKGSILTQIANYFMDEVRKAGLKVWAIDTGDDLADNTTFGYFAKPINCELIVRRYLTGSLWRKLRDGQELPWEDLEELEEKGMFFYEFQRFDQPIFTPTLKDDANNDPPISEAELVDRGIIWDQEELAEIKNLCLKIFELGERLADEHGLVLVDTKFEIGRDLQDGHLVIIDEVLTPDSSRYWRDDLWDDFSPEINPIEISKEFVRQDIITLMIEQGLVSPDPSDDEIKAAADKVQIPESKFAEWSEAYIQFYEDITGQVFNYSDRFHEEPLAVLENYLLNTQV
ncbi:hypothetical protein FWF93_01325 [Candidatus Saccharibacteria bacterium]|nr:hypothetical protein [Candidatus Saccharibacteria bacterium]